MCTEAKEARAVGPALFLQSVVCIVMDSHEFTHTALNFKMSVTDPTGNIMLNSAVKFPFRAESGWLHRHDSICEDQICFVFLNILLFSQDSVYFLLILSFLRHYC